ncbi:MAG TPA: hypothetical protein VE869_14110 [Gemmatimonas sp.]|nr:hypothetical protein [Gemmatimonas sp.]
MRPTLLGMLGMLAIFSVPAVTTDAAAQSRDTIFAEVGHPSIDGRMMRDHAARVRIYRGDSLVSQWLNELTVGDSAGRRVMRWVTTGEPVPLLPGRPTSVLRQTYDARTLAPLGYSITGSGGGYVHLTVDGKTVRGVRKAPAEAAPSHVETPFERIGFFAGATDLVPIAAGLRKGTVMVAPAWSPATPTTTEDRVFTVIGDTTVMVEGKPRRSTKVEEHRRATGVLYANWYLLLESPYMVYGELPLPDGRVQRMTEEEVPLRKP